MKYFIIGLFCLFAVNCSTVGSVVKGDIENKINKSNDTDFVITYNQPTEKSTIDLKESDKQSYLSITNEKTKETFRISYYDFKIATKAYQNWRVVEKATPTITEVNQDDKHVTITFNYIDNKGKSVLSGKVLINRKYIKSEESSGMKNFLWGALTATGAYGIILILVLVL